MEILSISIGFSILVILLALRYQWKYFLGTNKDRRLLKNLFPKEVRDDLCLMVDEESEILQIGIREGKRESLLFSEIRTDINMYLVNNKGTADFAILKDITERNCNALEQRIDATTPVPIYIGLCGTLVGIIVGVGILAFGGSLDAILSTSESASGAFGIRSLLQGVSVAMITTLVGVFFTILGSNNYKVAVTENERRKNAFLSWMQAELLPNMDNSLATVLVNLQRNMNRFNSDLSENANNLRQTFAGINESYKGQAEVIRSVQELRINDIAAANVRVLRELQQCTDKILLLQEFLAQTGKYLASVEALNGNLSNQYERTKLIENMGQFFMDEVRQVELRKTAILDSVANIDASLLQAFDDLGEHTQRQYATLKDATAQEHASFLQAVHEQQNALSAKLKETSELLEELHKLGEVKDSMMQLITVSNEQNSQLIELKNTMKDFVTTSSKQANLLGELRHSIDDLAFRGEPSILTKLSFKLPVWVKVLGATTCLVLIGTCAFFIIKTFI